MRSYLALAAMLAVAPMAACGVGAAGGDDDAGPIDGDRDGGDGGTPSGGLELRFVADPEPPVDLGGELELRLDEIRIDLTDLRVVGDAAPGDDRTRVDRLEVRWPHGDADAPTVRFDRAPPGMYSSVLATITMYDLRGIVHVDGDNDFRIEESAPSIALSLPLPEIMVVNGETTTIEVTVALEDLLRGIPWDSQDVEDDHIEIDEDSSIIVEVRAALRAAFVAPVGPADGTGSSGTE